MLQKLKQYKKSIWRVPLIAITAGFLYAPLYVQIVVRFGVIEPGRIDDRIGLITSAGILLAVFLSGGLLLRKKQSKKEILFSAGIVSLYGIILFLIQFLSGTTTGPAAVIFMYLYLPLEWIGFFPKLFSYVQNHFGISLPIIWWLRFFAPLSFVLFGHA